MFICHSLNISVMIKASLNKIEVWVAHDPPTKSYKEGKK